MSQSTSRDIPDELRKPNENHTRWVLRRIWDRINRDNEHFMGCIVGREGSGKSWTAIKIAATLDPTFNADRVIFQITDLLEILRNGDHEPGNFYVLDEAGVQLGNRTWHDRGQILANQALQLIRKHNLGLLFTIPVLGDMDSQAQNRLQAYYEVTEKEPGEYVRGRWLWIDPDRTDSTGERYTKYPRRRQNGQTIRVTSMAFTPPPQEIVEPYEERKDEFLDGFYEQTIGELNEEEEEEEDQGQTLDEVAEQIVNGGLPTVVDTHGTTGEPYINRDLIRHEYDLSHSDARTVKTLVENKVDSLDVESK
jgi:ABC-type dipeptide/oligopeptide/nickel transport system ATPase component